MDDVEDKTTMEAGKKPEGEAESQTAESKPGGSKKLLLFGIVGIGAIVVGVVLALFVLRPMMSGSDGSTDSADKGKSGQHGKNSESGATPVIYSVKDIVVNPANTGGTRFLSVSFGFEVESEELARQLEGRDMMVRDVLITILSAKTVAQLTDPKQKEVVRYQIRKRISELLHTEELAAVYYTEFVLQ